MNEWRHDPQSKGTSDYLPTKFGREPQTLLFARYKPGRLFRRTSPARPDLALSLRGGRDGFCLLADDEADDQSQQQPDSPNDDEDDPIAYFLISVRSRAKNDAYDKDRERKAGHDPARESEF
jgi:hypothetical protein